MAAMMPMAAMTHVARAFHLKFGRQGSGICTDRSPAVLVVPLVYA